MALSIRQVLVDQWDYVRGVEGELKAMIRSNRERGKELREKAASYRQHAENLEGEAAILEKYEEYLTRVAEEAGKVAAEMNTQLR